MAKGTKVTAQQAKFVAEAMKKKKMASPLKAPAKTPMDAEDKLDGGVDEDTEG